ncbi:MAG TPA: hypothetical protein DDW17_01035 [Deltaproteobacteria bacterium]|nr:hypothetical protein [Deltaproteobacteria bacterium]
MVKRKTYFSVGLFVIIGVIIAAIAIIWVGASRYFEKGAKFATYFEESVQGLQIDSSVKYRGVDVGRVVHIGLAPDNRLVEVEMKIGLSTDVTKDLVAKLKTAGITGIVFIELDQMTPEDIRLSPKISFPSKYPVIPSRPSDIKQLFTGIDDIIQRIRQIDFKRVSNQVIETTKAIETFVEGERIKEILKNLDTSMANLNSASEKAKNLFVEGDIEGIVAEVGEAAAKTNYLIDTINRKMNIATTEIQVTAENMRRLSETLEQLIERLHADPSDIIFSTPPPKGRGLRGEQ